MEHGLQKVEVFVKGPGSGRETAIRSLQAAGLEILSRQGRHAAGAQRRPAAEAEARLVARDLGPKCRICRREGMKLFLKGERCLTEKCAIERRCVSAGRARPRPHQAERVPAAAAREAEGAPLLRPAREAVPHLLREGREASGVTGEELLRMLETRLDNVVYRLGFAASRAQARQLVRHGHFHVNGRRVNIPSYQVRPNDIVTVPPSSSAQQVDPRRDRSRLDGRSVAPGRPRRAHRQGAEAARARRDRHAGAGAADRRALLEVTERGNFFGD